jgi:hypothetical protein
MRTLLLFLILNYSSSLFAQETHRFHSAGYTVGYGFEINNQAKYNLIFLAGDFSWQFSKGPKKNFLSFYLEPQVNPVFADGENEVEFGANIGLRYYFSAASGNLFYAMIGSGPHFISAEIPRQANGFIFSDNLGIGYMKQFRKGDPLFLNFQLFVRHISNAGFKEPNGGVNTLNFRIGISRVKRP